jgi:phosphoenolpyruvate-protein phosphotransferase
MSEVLTYKCELKDGIHARPAGHIERLCNTFQASICWKNMRSGQEGDARSALSIVGTDTLLNDECEITISGEDEFDASMQLSDLLDKLPSFEAPEEEGNLVSTGYLPRSLRETRLSFIQGTRISGGVAIAKPVILQSLGLTDILARNPTKNNTPEIDKAFFLNGLELIKKEKQDSLDEKNGVEHDIIQAHISIITDPSFQTSILDYINDNGNAWTSIVMAAMELCEILERSSSKYIRERTLDILDITVQLLIKIYGSHVLPQGSLELKGPSIIFASSLTPSKFLAINKDYLAGMVLSSTGKTSHTAILARSLGIPTLTDIDFSLLHFDPEQDVVIDGEPGILVTAPDEKVVRYYRDEMAVQQKMQNTLLASVCDSAMTSDGHHVEVVANIVSFTEAEAAFSNGAEGIGLFRTEMSFMDRKIPPDYAELAELYTRVVNLAGGKPVIFRTFDIGGDKPVDYLNLGEEENPFLGFRAVRTYPQYRDLFVMQLKAILTASSAGIARIMIPMIANVDEVIWCREVLSEVKKEMRAASLPFREDIELGVMLEVPSVIFSIPEIAEFADFFSVGSNDLTQYFFAADRGNSRVESVYDNYAPSFLRAMQFAAKEVHRAGKWIGICGELGANKDFLPIFVGMEFDELSMSNASIPAVKHAIKELSYSKCQKLANDIVKAKNSLQVKNNILSSNVKGITSKSILSPEFILCDLDVCDRNEVIKKMIDNLWLHHRCDNKNKLCDDIWDREDSFPTAVGYGFSIPHARSEYISHSTVSVAKLNKPVLWGEQEVEVVFMLTISKLVVGNEHMKYFSTLARKLMNEGFRNEIKNAITSEELYKIIVRTLEV